MHEGSKNIDALLLIGWLGPHVGPPSAEPSWVVPRGETLFLQGLPKGGTQTQLQQRAEDNRVR